TDCVGGFPIITDDVFGHPEIALAEDAPNGEVLVGKQTSRRPDGKAATDALTRLGILQNHVVVVDLILAIVVAGLRRGPVPIQRGSDVSIIHLALLRCRGVVPKIHARSRRGPLTAGLPRS